MRYLVLSAIAATACATVARDPAGAPAAAPASVAAATSDPASAATPARPDSFASVAAFAESVTHRGGLPPTDDPWGDDATTLRHLEQNWGPIEGIWFYFGSQGSRLIRRDLLLNLEVADGERPLAGPETWARYRLLAQEPSPNNPDGLPVGFTRDGDAIGLTCAACHTGQFVYEGAAVRVDGAPALMDMNGLLSAFEASVDATLADEAKLGRLLVALGASGDAEAEAAGRRHLQQAQLFLRSYNADFASNPGGYGRIDAIGGILNQVVRVTSGPGHSVPADAPTSYPLIWDAPRHDWVQWTAFSSNGGPGSLARNTGEVVGVFGELHVTGVHDEADNRGGYDTSIKAHNLVDLEETVWKLQSPVWPEDVLPPIDRDRAARGAAVYAETCLGCHALLDRDDPKRRVVAQVIDVETVGTDPRTADNLIGAVVPTGTLEGSLTPDGLAVLGPEASALDMIIMVSGNALKSNKAAVVRTLANAKRWGLEESPKQGMVPADTPDAPLGSLRAYKARPLNGVWASAPYLHNGSVPTLYDLMLPEEQRPARFAVGRWTFDPVRVGYVTDGEAPGVFDTTVPGNHNTGHRFGAALSDADRWALVEYLKTL